jgi:primary-amine oxidase
MEEVPVKSSTRTSIAWNKVTCLLWLLLLPALPVAAQNIEHPLDPLSFQEYWTVLEVLRDAGHLDDETRFSIVNLKEPSKNLVWGWAKGNRFPREASAIVRQG